MDLDFSLSMRTSEERKTEKQPLAPSSKAQLGNFLLQEICKFNDNLHLA